MGRVTTQLSTSQDHRALMDQEPQQAEVPASEEPSTPTDPKASATTVPPTTPAKILQVEPLIGHTCFLALDQDGSVWIGTLADDPRVPSPTPIEWVLIWSGP